MNRITSLCLDEITHDVTNDWECDVADCVCHAEHRTEEYDASAWCDCESCQFVRQVLSGGQDA